MNKHQNTFTDANGYVKSRYMFSFHLAGIWLPVLIGLFAKLGFNALIIIIAVMISVGSTLVFVAMRLVLKLIERFVNNTGLKFGLWWLSAEFFAYLFYKLVVSRYFVTNGTVLTTYKTFPEWHFDMLAFAVYFCPIYFTVVAGFVLELFYTEDKNTIPQQDILDSLDNLNNHSNDSVKDKDDDDLDVFGNLSNLGDNF